MAGKAYAGGITNRWNGREQKAYCEGMSGPASGAAVVAPITNNPYIGNVNEARLKTAWDAGWQFAQDGPKAPVKPFPSTAT